MTASFKPLGPRAFAMIALLALAVSGSPWAAESAASFADSCQCDLRREYARAPTPEVEQLFAAARRADEATFARLIKTIPDVNEYAVDGMSLLAALLRPVEELAATRPDARVASRQTPEESERLRTVHRASLPAKTRMLALALTHGASVKEMSNLSRQPPLHLAVALGTPEMVRLLLKHGADPNQINLSDSQTPIEFALDNEMFMRMTYLPSLVGVEQRTEMVLDLLAAGARRPYLSIDEYAARTGESIGDRPAADHLLWPALVELTEGAAVLEAMSKLGTHPVFDADNASLSPLAHAARAGNVGGFRWLKARAPRRIEDAAKSDGRPEAVDLWVSAAAWALYPSTNDAEAQRRSAEILRELLVPGLQWEQRNGLRDDSDNILLRREPELQPRFGGTLMHHLVVSGRTEWVEQAVRLGAPVDGLRTDGRPALPTPLREAVRVGNALMVKQLLTLGADLLAAPEGERSALDEVIAPKSFDAETTGSGPTGAALAARREVLATLLASMTEPQKAALGAARVSPLASALELHQHVDPVLVRLLLKAGISAAALDGRALAAALRSNDPGLVVDLLDHGATIREGAEAAAIDLDLTPTLVDAMFVGQTRLLGRLLQAGANPNARFAGWFSAVDLAIKRGDQETLDLLLAHGGRITVAEPGRAPATASSLDMAIASANEAMLRRIRAQWGGDLSRACLNHPPLLVSVVLDTTDAYWESLLAQGLGQKNPEADPCPGQPPMAVRLVGAVLDSAQGPQVGWRDGRLTERLKYLWQSAVASGQLTRQESAHWSQMARDEGRDDVIRALLHAGVSDAPAAKAEKPGKAGPVAPGKPSARDKALAKQLRGIYYLTGMREVGSEIFLEANGQFQFTLVYGAEDQLAAGTWTVRDRRVLFRTPSVVPNAKEVPFKRLTEMAPAVGAEPGAVSVRAVIRERDVPDVNVTVMGCAAPHMERGRTAGGGWRGVVSGPLCQILLQHPKIDRGRPFVYEVQDATEASASRDFVFEVQLPNAPASIDFNVDMRIDNGKLLWDRGGRLLTYKRQ